MTREQDTGTDASETPDEKGYTDGGYATTSPVDAEPSLLAAERTGGVRRTLGQVWTTAHHEYRLAIRGRWALALTGLFVAFGLLVATFSGSEVAPTGFERTVASLAGLATYLVPLAALVFGYDAVVGARERGWLDIVYALPAPRWRIVAGTFLGRALVLAGSTVIGFGVAGLLLLREFGTGGWTAYLAFLAAAVGVGAAFLALSVLLSTLASEKTHALGGALLVWVWFVLIHDLLAMGIVAAFDLSSAAVSAFLLANPASIFRVLTLSALDASGGGFAAVLASTGLSVPVLVAALLAWIVVPVTLAAAVVEYREI